MDAFEWSHDSDGLVLVVCPGVTTQKELAKAWADLHQDKVPFLGFVLNKVNVPIGGNYFRSARSKQMVRALQRLQLPGSKSER